MGSTRATGPNRINFNRVRPWDKTCRSIKFHQNISKITEGWTKETTIDGWTDRQAKIDEITDLGSFLSLSGCCIHPHKLSRPLHYKRCRVSKKENSLKHLVVRFVTRANELLCKHFVVMRLNIKRLQKYEEIL